MMSEKEVWDKFKDIWPYHCERQEPGLGQGQPDVVLLDRVGRIGYVELKAPDRSTDLRPSQWTWHDRWQRNKGRSCMLTKLPSGPWVLKAIITVPSYKLRIVQETNQPLILNKSIAQMLGLTV